MHGSINVYGSKPSWQNSDCTLKNSKKLHLDVDIINIGVFLRGSLMNLDFWLSDSGGDKSDSDAWESNSVLEQTAFSIKIQGVGSGSFEKFKSCPVTVKNMSSLKYRKN